MQMICLFLFLLRLCTRSVMAAVLLCSRRKVVASLAIILRAATYCWGFNRKRL